MVSFQVGAGGQAATSRRCPILAEGTARTKPDDVTVTSWLMIVAELPEEA